MRTARRDYLASFLLYTICSSGEPLWTKRNDFSAKKRFIIIRGVRDIGEYEYSERYEDNAGG